MGTQRMGSAAMGAAPKEAKGKFKEHRRHTLNKQIIPTKWQIRMAMVCRAAIMEAVKSGRISREEWEQSEMHGDDFYDSKWNKDSISDWIGTWYNSKRIRPAKEIWNRFPRAMASEMLEDWKKGIDKSDYSTPNVTGFRKASSVQSKAKQALPSVIPPREPGTLFAATPNTSASKRRFFRYSGRLRGREALNLPYAPADRVYSEAQFRELIRYEDITEPWRFVQKHGGRMKEGNGGWECVGLHSYHSVGDKWLSSDFMKAGIFIGRQKPDEAEVLRLLKWKFSGHTDAEYANGVRQCLKLADILMECSRPAPQKRVRELVVTQPQAPAPKKAKAAAPKPRKPMQWDKVTGGHNGQDEVVGEDEMEQEIKFMAIHLCKEEIIANQSGKRKKKLIDLKEKYEKRRTCDRNCEWYHMDPRYTWDEDSGCWKGKIVVKK